MELTAVLQFWAVCLMLVCSPGADWAFAIGAGVRAKRVWPSISGILVGYAIVVAVIAAGLGMLAVQFPAIVTVMTLVGSLYLLYLGVSAIRTPNTGGDLAIADLDADSRRQFVQGIGVSALNPKGLLLLLALLPQFVTVGSVPTGLQMAALGGLHIVSCAIVYSAVALVSRRALRGRPTASVWVTRGSGMVLLCVGAVLLFEQLASMH